RVMHHLVELRRQSLVDLADPELDVRLDVLGDHLARLDNLTQETLEIILGPFGLLVRLRFGGSNDLVEQAGRFLGLNGGPSRGGGLCTHYLVSSGLVPSAGISTPSSFARDWAFSVLASTLAKSWSSLSLPSILLNSWVSRWRISSNSRSGPICSATLA